MKITAVLRTIALALAACLCALGLVTVPAQAQTQTLTNLDHLDFLLDEVRPGPVAGHTTYRLAEEPDLIMPWTYADARADGTFARIGGGTFDPATGHYSQGAYNTDDITRAAVVYLRHWRQTRDAGSRDKAYELLRSVAYMQTSAGRYAGNSVLWIQADGQLNPSAEPVELPDPSDSGPSYWQARTVWALGEGYAAFRRADPDFARFLQARLQLAVRALERQVLVHEGRYQTVDGVRLPAWLIADGADATAEAVLGLSAYLEAAPGDRGARDALDAFARGIAEMSAGDRDSWPYGAVLPWAKSRSVWHAWGSQMSAALARSADALDRPALLRPAVREAVSFDPTLLTAGGPDNGWLPTPTERVQIAYGADSRVQNLLAVAEVGSRPAARELAALAAAWFFGANRSGQPVYDPATGVTFDGVAPDGTINRNSGAESTIHGLLTMLALDAHPRVRERARGVATVAARDGLRLVEAESATSTTGAVETPAAAWTGESLYSGQVLVLDPGERAEFDLSAGSGRRLVEPVSWLEERVSARSVWRQDGELGVIRHRVGAQGVTEVPGALLAEDLNRTARASGTPLTVTARRDTVRLDALLVRPMVSRLRMTGPGGATELVHAANERPMAVRIGFAGERSVLRAYDRSGRLVRTARLDGLSTAWIPAGGLLLVSR